jgi:hypothetical protein
LEPHWDSISRMIGECDVTNIRANAVVILYALQFRNAFKVQYTKDGVDPDFTSQNDEDREEREDESNTTPKRHDLLEWFCWLVGHNSHVP